MFDYAISLGKRVFIISDMYQSEEFLADMLRSKGFDGFERLLVSSHFRRGKWDGQLFQALKREYNVDFAKQVHFGDNHHSDF